jgi:hypothetical protein
MLIANTVASTIAKVIIPNMRRSMTLKRSLAAASLMVE